MNFWGNTKLGRAVFGVGFFQASVKVGAFGLCQFVAVGKVSQSKFSTRISKEAFGFSLGQSSIGIGVSYVVLMDPLDVLSAF
jgi:hypothetical protein